MVIVKRLLGVDDISFLRSIDVQLIFLISMVSSTAAIASPALPAMGSDLGISNTQIGLVFTAFTLPAILFLPFIGAIADLYGRKTVVVPGLVLFGVSGMAVGFADSFSVILILRGLQGIGYTAFNSLTVALLGDLLTNTEESAAQGTRVILNKITSFVAPAFAGLLAVFSWRYPFYLYLIGVPMGILVYFRFKESSQDNLSTTTATKQPQNHDTLQVRFQKHAEKLRELTRDRYIAVVLGAGFFRMFMKYALYTYLAFAIVEQYNGSLGYAGTLIGLYSLIGAVIASQTARFIEHLTHSYALLLGFIIAAIGFIGFPFADGLVMVTILILLHGVGEGIINPVHKSILTQSVETGIRAGFVTSNAIIQNIAKTLAPVLLAPLLILNNENQFDIIFFITGSIVLIMTISALVSLIVGWITPRYKAT